MLSDFWRGLGGKLAERWLAALFSPAFVFWAGGFAAWLYGHGWSVVQRLGWLGALRKWTGDVRGLPAVVQVLLILVPLIVITLSGLLLQRISRPALRLLEGYWPAGASGIREWSRRRISDRADGNAGRLRVLLPGRRQGSALPKSQSWAAASTATGGHRPCPRNGRPRGLGTCCARPNCGPEPGTGSTRSRAGRGYGCS